MTGIRVLLLALFVPMLIRLFRGKCGRLIWTDFLFIAFGIWNFVPLYVNTPAQALSYGGSVILEFTGGYLLSRVYVRDRDSFIAMIKLLLLVIVITIPFTLIENMTARSLIPEMIRKLPVIDSIRDFNNAAAGKRMGLFRAQSVFDHPIHYGFFCSTAISLAFVGLRGVVSNVSRYLATIAAGLGVFLSLSSGAILPAILQIGLILWAAMLHKIEARWNILLVLFALAYVTVDLLSNRTPITVFLSHATFSSHNAYWRMIIFDWGMKNVWAHPIFGLGLGDWVRPWYMRSGSMDNHWLLMAVRYGIPGFLLMASGFLLPLWTIAKRNFDDDRLLWQLRRAWMFTILSVALTLATVALWASVFSYLGFLFGAGMWFLSAEPASAAVENDRKDADTSPQRPTPYTRFAQSRERKRLA